MLIHLGIKNKERITGTVLHKIETTDKFFETLKDFINENGSEEFFDEIMRGQYEGGIYSFDWEGGITMLESGRRHSMGSEHCLNTDTFGKGADISYLVEGSDVKMLTSDILHVEDGLI